MGSGLRGTMCLWIWLLYFLPVSGTRKLLPEVQLDAECGGSITIQCPLPQTPVRMYLCRQMTNPELCATVVSNSFVKEKYKRRVTLTPCLDKKLFLVEITQLTKSDSGVYACGVGVNTDLGKTQKITLNVHNEYEPFWEDEPTHEPPPWFYRFLQEHIPSWLPEAEHASSSEFTSEVTTPAPRTEALVHQPSSTIPVTHHHRVSRTPSVTTDESPALLPTTTASRTSAQQALRPLGASYSHHTKLHGQRTLHHSPPYGREDQGLHIPVLEFHILIPTFLGFLLLVLLGLVVKRVILRRKAFSRRMGRVGMRIRGREASSQFPAQRPQRQGAPQRPRSQNNVYSACPRRAPIPEQEGSAEASLLGAPASASLDPSQVLEASWSHTPPLKTSCDYVTLCYQPPVNVEDTGSDDYINIPGSHRLPSCPSGPRPSCQ
ncbi:fas apoptotic inhibitory molecule 3 [Phodopus roborovskii]|uniref:Fcmr protein n=1 Tax=Phodopus roborovskii TaxID=109678 RepID=A0AAV0A4P4_PHORO|nr:fas apoptotic inhibitory molecule 3 [Phodopus roborovskii]CAH7197684.1 Fcmr [Phodopus roborovskii]